MAVVGNLIIEMAANVARLQTDFQRAQSIVDRHSREIINQVETIDRRFQSMAGVAQWVAGFAAMGGITGKLVSVQREFDVLNSSLVTVTGSSAAAEREFAWLKEFAKETPFGLAQATQGFVKMKALGLDPTKAALTSFGNTASAMGKDLNQMIEAVADAVTGEFERLKEFGVKTKKEGDNVSFTFQGLTTTVKNNAEAINQYLTAIGDNQFAGAMADRAKTLDGAIAELGDTWDELFRTISGGDVGGYIQASVQIASGAIGDLIAILNSLNDQTNETSAAGERFSIVQNAIAVVAETVSALGVNVAYVFRGIGNELGGILAQANALLSLDFSAASAIGQQMKADAAAARAEVDRTTEAILTARTRAAEYAKIAKTAAETGPFASGSGGQNDLERSIKAFERLPKVAASAGKAARGTARAVKQVKDELLELLKELDSQEQRDLGLSASYYKDLNTLHKAYEKGRLTLAQYQERVAQLTNAQQFAKDAVRDNQQALDELIKTKQEAADAEQKQLDSAREMLETLQFEASLMGLTNEERETAVRLRELERQGIVAGTEAYTKYARRILEVSQANAQLKRDQDAVVSLFGSIDQTAHDVFVNIFEDGAGTFKRLGDTLKASVLDLLYQLTIKQWIIQIGASFAPQGTAGAVAQALGGGGNNLVGNLLGSYSDLSTVSNIASFLGAGSTAGASMVSLGAANAVGAIGGDAIGTLIAMNGGWAGVATGAGAGASAVVGAGAAGASTGAMAGVSSALAAVPVWGWVALAALAIFGGDLFGRSTREYGSVAEWTPDGVSHSTDRDAFGTGFTQVYQNDQMQDMVGSVAQMIGETMGRITGALGLDSSYTVATGFADDGAEASWGALRIRDAEGRELINWNNDRQNRFTPREFAPGEEGAQEYLRALAGGMLDALGDAGLPDWAGGVVAATRAQLDQLSGEQVGEQAWATVDQMVQALQLAQRQLDLFTASVQEFAGVSQDNIYALVQLAGGADQFSALYGQYARNFKTEAEQQEYALRQMQAQFDALGLALPETRDAFAGLVEGADLSTESGRQLFLALMQLQGAFAELHPQVDQVADAARDEAAAQAEREQAHKDAMSYTDAVMAAFSAARQKEVDGLQQHIEALRPLRDELAALFDMLEGHVRELYNSVPATQTLLASQGRAFVADALAGLRATGSLPDAGDLGDAITAARSGMVAENYGSAFEMMRDRLVLAGQLDEMRAAAGEQLTGIDRQIELAEDEIKAINRLVEEQQATILEIRSLGGPLGTIAELAAAIQAERAAKKAAEDAAREAQKSQGGVSFGGGGGSGGPGGTRVTSQGDVNRLIAEIEARGNTAKVQADISDLASGEEAWYVMELITPQHIKDIRERLGNTAGMNAEQIMQAAGTTNIDDLAMATGKSYFELKDELFKLGYYSYFGNAAKQAPGFAQGINRVPFDMFAQIHEGEAVLPAEFNPFNPRARRYDGADENPHLYGRSAGDMAGVLSALVERMDRVSENTARTADSSDQTARRINSAQPLNVMLES